MLRSDMIKKVLIDHPNLTGVEAENIVYAFLETIIAHLAKGGRVELRGFGVFTARQRGSRLGRNPKTGEAVQVDAKRAPHFSPGKVLSQRLMRAYDAKHSVE